MPVLPVRDKSSGKARATFGDIKLKMVMILDHCGREEAVGIIAARPEELREQEKARHDAGGDRFHKCKW